MHAQQDLALCSLVLIASAQTLAKRNSGDPSQPFDICGPNSVDCGNSWCCMENQICQATTGDPVCLIPFLTTVDGSTMSWSAYNQASWSSLMAGSTFQTSLTGSSHTIAASASTSTGTTTRTATASSALTSSRPSATTSTIISASLGAKQVHLDGTLFALTSFLVAFAWFNCC